MADSELPEGWTTATIGDTAEYINGRGFKKSEWEGKGRPIIRIQNLTRTTNEFNYTTLDVNDKYVVPPGTILVSWSATLDTFRWHGPEGVLNQHIFKVVPNEDLVDENFLFWLLKREIQEMVRSAKLQGSTMKHIRRDSFLDHKFPLPPKPEQQRIANRLDAIQSCTQATGETLAEVPDRIEEYRQSVLNAAFTGRLTADWREDHSNVESAEELLAEAEDRRTNKYKKRGKLNPVDEGLTYDIPRSWKWAQIGDVASHIRYGTSDKAKYENSGIPMIRMGDIEDGKIHFDDLKYMPEGWDGREKFLLEDGDLLFNRTNSAELVGKSAVYKDKHPEAVFASYLVRAKLHRDIYAPDLLASYINSAHGRLYVRNETKQQVGQANVNATKLASMPIPVPPAEEQKELLRRVRQRLDKIDEMARHVEQAGEWLDHLDRSVLAKAFRGELVETEAERSRREDRDYETAEELLKRMNKKTTPDTDTTAPKSDGKDSTEVNENGQIQMKVIEDGDAEL